jgi:hypothetical protein
MGEESVRWSIIVDREMDIDVRTRLAQKGMKKGDLSKFVKDAVNWRLLRLTMAEIQDNFKDMAPDEREALIEEAIVWARSPEGIASDVDSGGD